MTATFFSLYQSFSECLSRYSQYRLLHSLLWEEDRVFQKTFVSNVDGILCPFLYKWMQIIESVAWLHEIEVQNNPDVVIYRHIDTV